MPESEKIKIADEADMIVRGYAFKRNNENIRVVNLNKAEPHVMIFSREGKMLESSMDPIEQAIALDIWKEDPEFMEYINGKLLEFKGLTIEYYPEYNGYIKLKSPVKDISMALFP